MGMNCVYVFFCVFWEYFFCFVVDVFEFGIKGFSVMIFYKEDILCLVNVMDEDVVGICVVNMIFFIGEKMIVYNMDCKVVIWSLLKVMGFEFEDEEFFKNKWFLLLGIGGVVCVIGWGIK